jgi:hypothetical protein
MDEVRVENAALACFGVVLCIVGFITKTSNPARMHSMVLGWSFTLRTMRIPSH